MKYCSEFISILNYALIYNTWHTMKFGYLLLTVSTVSVTAVSVWRIADGFINCNALSWRIGQKFNFIYIFWQRLEFHLHVIRPFLFCCCCCCRVSDSISFESMNETITTRKWHSLLCLSIASTIALCTLWCITVAKCVHECVRRFAVLFVSRFLFYWSQLNIIVYFKNRHTTQKVKWIYFCMSFYFFPRLSNFQRENLRIKNLQYYIPVVTYLRGVRCAYALLILFASTRVKGIYFNGTQNEILNE